VSKDLFEYEMRNLESIDSSQNKDEYNKQLRYVDSLKSVLGQLVFYKGKNKNFDTVYRKPEKVGLLVNYACMSASEAMILDMRQSAKVVVFGENTAGAIDNTNTFAMRTPSGKYSIWMPTFRGISTPLHERYAGKGISPDVRITNGEQDWLKIAIKYLESH
jgi:C-terminal processing protease CtpA/Prc